MTFQNRKYLILIRRFYLKIMAPIKQKMLSAPKVKNYLWLAKLLALDFDLRVNYNYYDSLLIFCN